MRWLRTIDLAALSTHQLSTRELTETTSFRFVASLSHTVVSYRGSPMQSHKDNPMSMAAWRLCSL